MVSFTGSTAVGRQISAQAAPTVKRVALELGGKSAQIYFPDAVERVAAGARGSGGGDGRTGLRGGHADAGTPRSGKTRSSKPWPGPTDPSSSGPPTDPRTHDGPGRSVPQQRDRCERYVSLAEEHGGKVASGGGRPASMERGYYFEPTVLDLPDNSNPAAQDEIFGPVLGVIGYQDLDDAVRIANDSVYGLSAQVYGADPAAATAVARRLRAGQVNVNTAVFSAYAPGGGYKQSGLGRERGPDGIRAFQQVKHMAIGELSG